MTWKSHINIALRAVNDSGIQMNNVEKLALIIGSIAPDTYLFIKIHKACHTRKNILYHIKSASKAKKMCMYYFQLGVITHYICDYYCKAHNYIPTMSFGKHWSYEKSLGRYIKEHLKATEYSKLICDKSIGQDSIDNYILKLEENHECYLKELYKAVNSFESDLIYSLSMCNRFISSVRV